MNMSMKIISITYFVLIFPSLVYASSNVINDGAVCTKGHEEWETHPDEPATSTWVCDQYSPEQPYVITVYKKDEVDQILSAINAKASSLEAKNTVLQSTLEQREADIKFLSDKADAAEKRMNRLENALKEIASKQSTNKNNFVTLKKSNK